jgi:streptogramin lyase
MTGLTELYAMGNVKLNGLRFPDSDSAAGKVLKTDGAGQLYFADDEQGVSSGEDYLSNSVAITGGTIEGLTNLKTTGSVNLNGVVFPTSNGSTGQVLKVDSNGELVFANETDGSSVSSDMNVSGEITSNGIVMSNSSANITSKGDLIVEGDSTIDSLKASSANIGGVKFPTSDGISGQVIKTDGSGQLYFAADITGAGGSSYDPANVDITGGVIDGSSANLTTLVRDRHFL